MGKRGYSSPSNTSENWGIKLLNKLVRLSGKSRKNKNLTKFWASFSTRELVNLSHNNLKFLCPAWVCVCLVSFWIQVSRINCTWKGFLEWFFWIWEQNKKSCKTLTKFRKVKWESLGFVVLFLLVWEKTSVVCSLLEAARAAEVHWAWTVQHAWQLPGSEGIHHCEINCKQDKLHCAPGLQEGENSRFLYHQCGGIQTSEEVKEMETIWPTSLCRWYCREKMINHKIGFGPWEKMLNNKAHDCRHFSFT